MVIYKLQLIFIKGKFNLMLLIRAATYCKLLSYSCSKVSDAHSWFEVIVVAKMKGNGERRISAV